MTRSIKGIAMQSVIEDVRKAIDSGRLSRDVLEVKLDAEDLRAVDEEVGISRWYPMDSFRRLLDVLADVEAPGDRRAYLIRRGERAADRIAGSGLYRQLDLSTGQFGPRVGSLVVTVSGAIYNYTRWSYAPDVEGDLNTFRLHVDEAREFPEAAVLTCVGFVKQIASRVANVEYVVTEEWPRPDRLVFVARRARASASRSTEGSTRRS
jgi:hypothetical protein